MSWVATISGHVDDEAAEKSVLEVLRKAVSEIDSVVNASASTQFHGMVSLLEQPAEATEDQG